MLRLHRASIMKYKCFQSEQSFELDGNVAILVGMNESGKTSILEAIAKTNYFQSDDDDFQFDLTLDYPRREKKKIDKSGEDPTAIVCEYEVTDELLALIAGELGEGVVTSPYFCITTKYSNKSVWSSLIGVDLNSFVSHQTQLLGISTKTLNEKLVKVSSLEELNELIASYSDEKYVDGLTQLRKYYENKWDWSTCHPIVEYISRVYLFPNRPKFLYYDEYYSLPSRISIEKLEAGTLTKNELKTARALFELADINIHDLLEADSFEDFIAELEATEAIISDELFKYWKTNTNLQIVFRIDKIEKTEPPHHRKIVEHILDVRVKNRYVSLPLQNRSKGFNWFFSFLVWFKKIQEDHDSNYILLLDEPGLNLHASAQADLLRFLEDLSADYQIVYTTHSPFMIAPEQLSRVRTVVEAADGATISDSIQEKDPNTLFPLQAALGYDIAQNLFISPNNLLVEGVSDLVFLQALSSVLEANGRVGLRSDITIVPTGGLDRVATFISLLRGSKLNIACLLDSFVDPKGRAKVEDLVKNKIIQKSKIRFIHEFLSEYSHADLEDLFAKQDYLKLFNLAFSEHNDIQLTDLRSDIKPILIQITQFLGIRRFNHFRPANQLARLGVDISFFEPLTLDNFESVFRQINQLFE